MLKEREGYNIALHTPHPISLLPQFKIESKLIIELQKSYY